MKKIGATITLVLAALGLVSLIGIPTALALIRYSRGIDRDAVDVAVSYAASTSAAQKRFVREVLAQPAEQFDAARVQQAREVAKDEEALAEEILSRDPGLRQLKEMDPSAARNAALDKARVRMEAEKTLAAQRTRESDDAAVRDSAARLRVEELRELQGSIDQSVKQINKMLDDFTARAGKQVDGDNEKRRAALRDAITKASEPTDSARILSEMEAKEMVPFFLALNPKIAAPVLNAITPPAKRTELVRELARIVRLDTPEAAETVGIPKAEYEKALPWIQKRMPDSQPSTGAQPTAVAPAPAGGKGQ
ncbi:MAG: hypothetical protein HY719_10895 [Planctomycetes bacterium]|nr:hypothetical protein [Planctomycetota bacterium]